MYKDNAGHYRPPDKVTHQVPTPAMLRASGDGAAAYADGVFKTMQVPLP